MLVWLKLAPQIAPVQLGGNISEPSPTTEGVKRADSMIPEIELVHNTRRSPSGYTVKIVDSDPSMERAEFPSSW